MKIAIANDHGGINFKKLVIEHLTKKGIDVVDYGYQEGGEPSPDYPDYALPACKAVVDGECDLGILICGTGIGMSIVANKVKGIRCGHCHDAFSARMTREHNHANMIAFGERVIGAGVMLDIVDAFLSATPAEGRHARRVEKVMAVENL
jgi:ribose 5-phosphate isomerase B